MQIPDRPAFGHCIVTNNYKFISIPRCASTYGLELFNEELKWEISNFLIIDHSNKTNLIVLRDPIERWKSAMLMYFLFPHLKVHINLNEPETIFDKLCFEPHTDLQVNFIKNLDLNNAVYFQFNNNLEYNMISFLEKKLGYKNIKFRNKHLEKQKKNSDFVMNKLTEILDYFLQNQDYKKKLLNFLKPDFDFYNNVTFYKEPLK